MLAVGSGEVNTSAGCGLCSEMATNVARATQARKNCNVCRLIDYLLLFVGNVLGDLRAGACLCLLCKPSASQIVRPYTSVISV